MKEKIILKNEIILMIYDNSSNFNTLEKMLNELEKIIPNNEFCNFIKELWNIRNASNYLLEKTIIDINSIAWKN